MITYLITNGQPIIGLLAGASILVAYYYMHLRMKPGLVSWLATNIFRNPAMTFSAESLFNVLSSFMVTIGGMLIILALLFLSQS